MTDREKQQQSALNDKKRLQEAKKLDTKNLQKTVRQKTISLAKKHAVKIRFFLAGVFNTAVDFVLFAFLANLVGWPKEIANIASTSVAISLSFFINYLFVWHSKKSKVKTALGFLVVSLFSAWVVQNIAIMGTTAILGENDLTRLIAKLVGSACGMVSNYLGYKLVF